jgi:hypothetical protein
VAPSIAQIDEILTGTGDLAAAGTTAIDEALQQRILEKVVELQAAGALRVFGNARQVPKRQYALEDLRLNKIDAERLLAPDEDTLRRVQRRLQIAALLGLTALSVGANLDIGSVGAILLATTFVFGLDQVSAGGGVSALLIDTVAQKALPQYRRVPDC